MLAPLDDIRFLADSANRVGAIEALAEGPRARAELRDVTGASAATISRTLGAFESRGWVYRDGNRYALTPLGTYIAGGFADLHDRVRTAHDLDGLFPWLPLEAVGIDAESLAGARVTVASEENPMAIATRIREVELRSTRSRSLAPYFPEPCIDSRHRAVTSDTQTFETVITPSVVEMAMSLDCAAKFEELVSAASCSMYVYDGDIACAGMLNDGTVMLVVKDDRNATVGLVETDDTVVVERFAETFEEYRTNAPLLTPGDLAGEEEYEVART
jgi:predicted transcriptional regulator